MPAIMKGIKNMDLKEIEKYILELQADELIFKGQNDKSRNESAVKSGRGLFANFSLVKHILLSAGDYILLYLMVRLKKNYVKEKKIVFTAKNFCTEENGVLEDRIVKPLFTKDIIFINQSKEIRLTRVNGQKVYNLGGLVKLISHLVYRKDSRLMRTFRSYKLINDSFIRHLDGTELYMLWFYDLNSLALVFSSYRNRIKLIEVQHGSIINYPPYVKPAPVKIADIFYVKNQPTIDYLKSHLCANYHSEYKLIPYPKKERAYVPGTHILYASTVEFNGLHPVFRNFLTKNTDHNLHVIVRLHPREKDKEARFAEELSDFKINYEFDHSKNWLEGCQIKNIIVISPWSSTLEDAYDNGFICITIDKVGKERYKHLIDEARFFYSEDLLKTFSNIHEFKTV